MSSTITLLPPATATAPASSTPATRLRHLKSIDWLRGFAALSVCLFHFSDNALTKFDSPRMAYSFSWGYLGVDVFFVISGFVIPYSMCKAANRLQDLGGFLARRALRICPTAYASLALLLLQTLAIWLLLHGKAPDTSLSRLTSNLLFLVPFTKQAWYNGVFWTLAIEFQFYLLIGLLFNVLFVRPTVVRFLLIGTALTAAQYLPFLPKENYLQFNALFMLGGVSLLYFRQQLPLAACLFLGGGFTLLTAVLLSPVIAAFGAGTALCILLLRVNHPLGAWLGNLSFALYLTHYLVGSTFEFLLAKVYHPTGEAGHIGGILLCTLVALFAAALFHKYVEQPLLRLGKRLLH